MLGNDADESLKYQEQTAREFAYAATLINRERAFTISSNKLIRRGSGSSPTPAAAPYLFFTDSSSLFFFKWPHSFSMTNDDDDDDDKHKLLI